MAEGHLTQSEVTESLIGDSITSEQFANKLKEYTKELENVKQEQKQTAVKELYGLQNEIDSKDKEIINLRNRIEIIEIERYDEKREAYINEEIKKINWKTFWSFIIATIAIGLWFVNEFYCNLLPKIWSILASLAFFNRDNICCYIH